MPETEKVFLSFKINTIGRLEIRKPENYLGYKNCVVAG
jgi:hypothetical protein